MELKRKYYGIKDIHITSDFPLEQCLCSCWKEHNKDCPNYGKEDYPSINTQMELLLDDGSKMNCDLINIKWTLPRREI